MCFCDEVEMDSDHDEIARMQVPFSSVDKPVNQDTSLRSHAWLDNHMSRQSVVTRCIHVGINKYSNAVLRRMWCVDFSGLLHLLTSGY